MHQLQNNIKFLADYKKLRNVSLNPERHFASNAYEHCEMVRERAAELAKLNGCTLAESELLAVLSQVHDIGKITGTANPEASVELLPKYGIKDERLINLVKYHDINLPWYRLAVKGQQPSDKAWNKLLRKLDVRLLCLFMIADRIDCPGGWRSNRPLTWFLNQIMDRELLGRELVIDDGRPLQNE